MKMKNAHREVSRWDKLEAACGATVHVVVNQINANDLRHFSHQPAICNTPHTLFALLFSFRPSHPSVSLSTSLLWLICHGPWYRAVSHSQRRAGPQIRQDDFGVIGIQKDYSNVKTLFGQCGSFCASSIHAAAHVLIICLTDVKQLSCPRWFCVHRRPAWDQDVDDCCGYLWTIYLLVIWHENEIDL